MFVGNERVSAFNAQALAEGWNLHCSPCETLENPTLLALHQLWLHTAKGRRAPAKSDFSIRVLAPYLGHVTFVDRLSGSSRFYRMRFFGSLLASVTGDHTGKYLDEVLPPSGVRRWTRLYDLVLDTPLPLRVQSDNILDGLDHLSAEVFLAPLAADGDLPPSVLAACLFGPR